MCFRIGFGGALTESLGLSFGVCPETQQEMLKACQNAIAGAVVMGESRSCKILHVSSIAQAVQLLELLSLTVT